MKKKVLIIIFIVLMITTVAAAVSCQKAESNATLLNTEIKITDLDMPDLESNHSYAKNTETANTEKVNTVTSELETDTAATKESELESESEDTIIMEEHERSQYDKVIMVGDSRFKGMSAVISHPACEWICENGEGYSWLTETAAPLIDENIVQNCAIVINLGVNDPKNKNEYIEFINSRVADWVERGVDIYFMTVNPIGSNYNGSVTNNDIEDFNNTLMSNLSEWVAYIDTYNYLLENGFETTDGLHYDRDTYKNILEYCLRQLRVG